MAFNGNKHVRRRIQQASQDVWLSSIAAEESIRGALNLTHQNRDKAGSPFAHNFLIRLLSDICDYSMYPYDDQAARIYASFPAGVKRVGPQDCRIAASAIAVGWIVVTANQKDFSRIPGVRFEDWSR